MEQSALDFLKICLVFLLAFGFMLLAIALSQPMQKDYYSVLYLDPQKFSNEIQLSKGQIKTLVFDSNNSCHYNYPDINFSFGIANKELSDINYAVNYSISRNINSPESFISIESESIFVKKNKNALFNKRLSLAKTCVGFPFYVVLDAKTETQTYRTYYLIDTGPLSGAFYTVLYTNRETLPSMIALTQDQKDSLEYDANKDCSFNYPDFLFSYNINNLEAADMTYRVDFSVITGAGDGSIKQPLGTDNILIKIGKEEKIDKNLMLAKACINFPFRIEISLRSFKKIYTDSFPIAKEVVLQEE